jgi:hypothetical protein
MRELQKRFELRKRQHVCSGLVRRRNGFAPFVDPSASADASVKTAAALLL